MSALRLSTRRLTGATRNTSREAWPFPLRLTNYEPMPAIEPPLPPPEDHATSACQYDVRLSISHSTSSKFERREIYIEVKISDAAISFSDADDDMQDFIDKIIVMPSVSSIDQCIDVIFERFNELQLNGEFSRCDEAIEYLLQKMEKIEPTLLVSFLVITLAAKPKLRFRAALYSAVESAFLVLFGEDRTKKILVGLK
jgi:hypothetical protein